MAPSEVEAINSDKEHIPRQMKVFFKEKHRGKLLNEHLGFSADSELNYDFVEK